MPVNKNSNVPVYKRIYQQLLQYINTTIFLVNGRLPSVLELASMIDIQKYLVKNCKKRIDICNGANVPYSVFCIIQKRCMTL